MPHRTSLSVSELFIVDNSDQEWKVLKYRHEWWWISKQIDIGTGYFEIGSLLRLEINKKVHLKDDRFIYFC